jgi:multimeric flavodoxin WrbA
MKKIIIIDGGPRKNFNTASMLQKFAEGAGSVAKTLR